MIAFVFPGQGSQKVGMGQTLAEQLPESREVFEQANAIICVDFELGGSQQGATLSVVHGTACTIVPIRNYVPDGAMGNILADIADTLSKKG